MNATDERSMDNPTNTGLRIGQIKAVRNPLTIIAIFAALAEVAATVSIALVDKSLQGTFVWFVMGFPIGLVLLFFATMNFNSAVLYAPSDFDDELNYLKTLEGAGRVSVELRQIRLDLEAATKSIVEQARTKVPVGGAASEDLVVKVVTEQLGQVDKKLGDVERQATTVASEAMLAEAKLISYIASSGVVTTRQIAKDCKLSRAEARIRVAALLRLGALNVVGSAAPPEGGDTEERQYELTEAGMRVAQWCNPPDQRQITGVLEDAVQMTEAARKG